MVAANGELTTMAVDSPQPKADSGQQTATGNQCASSNKRQATLSSCQTCYICMLAWRRQSGVAFWALVSGVGCGANVSTLLAVCNSGKQMAAGYVKKHTMDSCGLSEVY